MGHVPLADGDIYLDAPTEGDIDRITECCQDPEIGRWTSVPSPYTRADSEHFLREWVHLGEVAGSRATWAVRHRPGDPLIGMIGLIDIANAAAEVGYWCAAEARGKGVMTKALRLVVDHSFDPAGLGLHHLNWRAQVGNWPSRRAAWRVGFRVEGTVRRSILQRGEWHDGWVGTLLCGDPRQPNTTWFDVPRLSGQTTMLRRFVESDADAVAEACSDPVSRHWLARLPVPYTRDVALAFINSREDDHAAALAVHWAAASPGGGPAVGCFSLMRFAHNGAEVGYWLHPAARGRGVATEAVRLIAGHALAPVESGGLGLRRLVLARAVGNDASGRVAERAGFRRTGLQHEATPLGDGSTTDLIWYELLAP